MGFEFWNTWDWALLALTFATGVTASAWFYRRKQIPSQRVLDSLPAWACLLDDQMRVVLMNKTGQNFFGHDNFMESPRASRLRALVKRFKMSKSLTFHVKMKLTGDFGDRWFLVTMNDLSVSKQVLVVGFDIHEQVVAEDLALEQRAAIEGSARMAAIGQVAAGIAHEINNPLAVMTAKAFQIRRRLGEGASEDDLHDLDKIEKTGFRIARIIKGLKSLSRDGERDPFEQVTLQEVLKDVLVMFEEKMKKNRIELITEYPTGLRFHARSTQIAQVLLNLIGNSYDAIKEDPDPWIRLEARADDLFVEITITDSGNGIPKELQEKLMTPFFTTKAAGQGTGLGLSISKRIISDHEGELRYNPAHRNTQFVIRLPLAQTSTRAS